MVDMILRETGLNLEIRAAWVNWTNGKKKDIAWHNHSRHDYALVYYMKTFPSIAVQFWALEFLHEII